MICDGRFPAELYENWFDWRKLLNANGRGSSDGHMERGLSFTPANGYDTPDIVSSGMCTQLFQYEVNGVNRIRSDSVCTFGLHPGAAQNSETSAKLNTLGMQLRDAWTGCIRKHVPVVFKRELITNFKPAPKFDGRGKKAVLANFFIEL